MSDFDLGHEEIVDALVEMIKEAPELSEFDFSWACLGPRHLTTLIESFCDNSWKLRQLNLSYNSLHFMTESVTYAEPSKAQTRAREKRAMSLIVVTPPGSAERDREGTKYSRTDQDSENFIEHLCEVITSHDRLVHLNLSGMNLTRRPLSKVCEAIASSPSLMSVHLSDNDITRDMLFRNNILAFFGMYEG